MENACKMAHWPHINTRTHAHTQHTNAHIHTQTHTGITSWQNSGSEVGSGIDCQHNFHLPIPLFYFVVVVVVVIWPEDVVCCWCQDSFDKDYLPSQVSFEPPSLSSRRFTLSRSFGFGFGCWLLRTRMLLVVLLWSSAAAAKDSGAGCRRRNHRPNSLRLGPFKRAGRARIKWRAEARGGLTTWKPWRPHFSKCVANAHITSTCN